MSQDLLIGAVFIAVVVGIVVLLKRRNRSTTGKAQGRDTRDTRDEQ